MNYKEMLDKFEFLEAKLAFLELENRHLKERVTKLEGNFWFKQPVPPQFTPGTLPKYEFWPNTVTCSSTHPNQFGDH